MAIVYQVNKKSGVTYAYESSSYWDKEKQQSRAKRKCLGKVDPITGEIIPTRKVETSAEVKRGRPVIESLSRSFYGATYLFDEIGEKLGITADLKKCFPHYYKQILSIGYYLILEDTSPLSRFPKWSHTHHHPHKKVIPSQRSSELFASIREADKSHFFKLQGKRRSEKEYLAYDTTSISSYSQCLSQVAYGVNKDHDKLPQINLALLYGQTSNLPLYYRKLAGNITDVKSVKALLVDLDYLGYSNIKLVMDRGFYSSENINALYANHLKFLVATKVSLNFVKKEIQEVHSSMRSWENYNSNYDLYMVSKMITWDFSLARPYKGDTIQENRRMYLHLYFNAERKIESERKFHVLLGKLENELLSNKLNKEHEKLYNKYFEVKSTPKRGITVTPKNETIEAASYYHGYFVLLSNEVKDPIEALSLYRNKDVVEKAFGNLKDRLSLRRTVVSSDASLDGKLFVQFVALIYLSYVKKMMHDAGLFKDYTLQGLLDELDIIECFEYPGQSLRVGEITKKQVELFNALQITPPSLQ